MSDCGRAWDGFVRGFDACVLAHLPQLAARLRALGDAADAPNILLYGVPGFPYLPIWSGLAAGDPAAALAASPVTWGPHKLPYALHPCFFHFNLTHPDMPKDGEALLDFLREVAPTRPVHGGKHVVVLENVDAACTGRHAQVLRVLLERYAANIRYVATTHRFGAMEAPLRSRFLCLRVALPSLAENAAIAAALGLPEAHARTRNTSLMLWSAGRDGVWDGDDHYPPLRDFLRKARGLQAVRDVANALCKENVALKDAAMDMVNALEAQHRPAVLAELARIEHMYQRRHKGREALYYELALHAALEPIHKTAAAAPATT